MDPPDTDDDAECCGTSCNPCSFDVHEQKLKRKKSVVNASVDQLTGENCTQPHCYTVYIVTREENVSESASLITFKFFEEDTTKKLVFNPGQYFLMKFENTVKAYWPVSGDSEEFTLLIKLREHRPTAKGAKKIEVGDETFWRGPYGNYTIDFTVSNLLCVAEGITIAPIYAIITKMLENEDCETFIYLFYCCQNHDDIYLHEQIYDHSSHWNFNFEIFLSAPTKLESSKYNETVHTNEISIENFHDYFVKIRYSKKVIIAGSKRFLNYVKYCLHETGVQNDEIDMF